MSIVIAINFLNTYQVSGENAKAIVIRRVAQCVGPVPHDELSNAFRLLLFCPPYLLFIILKNNI